MSMHYKFYITIGSSRSEVFPLNFFQTTLVDELERGQQFYRRKFNGTLYFEGTDFDLLYLAETVNPCANILFEIEQKDSGADTYHNYWDGYFSTTDGKFDLDRCIFEITPKPYDDYYEFDQKADVQYNFLNVPTQVSTTDGTYTYTHNRWLIEVIEYLLAQIIPLATVTSDFFTTATNYASLLPNKYTLLTIAQKSDIKRPASSNPATIAYLTWNEMMSILRMFNVYWKYDGATVRIEHISYFTPVAGLDLRTQKIAEKNNKYSYEKEKMPKYEKFSFMESHNADFVGSPIWYDSPCVNQDNESNSVEYSIPVTTDIEFIQDETDAISDDGFVIIANYLDGGNYYIREGAGYATGTWKKNIDLSWANLHQDLFRHDRILIDGIMNSAGITFVSARKTKLQETKAIICYEDNFEPDDYITTELGEEWLSGVKASVKTATLKPSGQAALKLLYGELSNENVAPTYPKVLDIVTTTDHIYFQLSEASTFDIYLWVYIDSTSCQEIVITAGLTEYDEALDETIDVDIAFNLSDPSLTGWNIFWNNGEPIIDAVGCPAAPPAAPVAPAISSINQAGNCDDVVITWTTPAEATYYELERNPDGEMFGAWGLIYAGSSNSYNDVEAGNTGGTLFTYRVLAGNLGGESAYSAEDDITPACI